MLLFNDIRSGALLVCGGLFLFACCKNFILFSTYTRYVTQQSSGSV